MAILLDIEGTTTPVAFVYKTLFPYARHHLREFLGRARSTGEARAELERLKTEHDEDLAASKLHPPPWPEDWNSRDEDPAEAYVLWLMDKDRKSTGLKGLQGKIWESGYREGRLRGEVFPDVPPAFERWTRQGRRIAIFSSGSALAQRLLFESVAGDLSPSISAYFDTTIGSKLDPASYRRITERLDTPASRILFVSDTEAELDAARTAGLGTALCERPRADAGSPAAEGEHVRIATFDEIP